jgi:hypothetical protein
MLAKGDLHLSQDLSSLLFFCRPRTVSYFELEHVELEKTKEATRITRMQQQNQGETE